MMSKKYIFIFVITVLVLGGVFVLLRGSEDTWICQNGEWVKHGNPASSMPSEPCEGASGGAGGIELAGGKVVLETPKPNDVIKSPLVVRGKARGNWYFEAGFPIKLFDENGKLMAQAIAQAKSDWMTTDFVPFEAILEFSFVTSTSGTLVLEKDNPSGLPEFDEKAEIPVRFTEGEAIETIKVKVFFNNDRLDPEFSCNKVFPVEREVPKTMAVARAALEELLKGATEAEAKEGFFSNINKGVKIQRLTIENGVAKVDFDEQLEFQVGGSCRVAAIRWQIIETLKQFPTVQDVVISINGRTEDILQP